MAECRAVIDLRHVQPKQAGIGRYTSDLLAQLTSRAMEANDRIEVLVAGETEQLWSERLGAETLVHAVPTGRLLRDVWEALSLQRYLAGAGVDVLHSPAFLLPLRPLKIPTVLTVHDLTSFMFPQWHDRMIGPRFRFRVRRSILQADVIIAVSEATRVDIHKWFDGKRDRVLTVYPGISTRFQPGQDGQSAQRLERRGIRPPFILTVGTLEPRKNHIRLIKAFEQLSDPTIRLVIAGQRGWLDGPILEAVRTSPRNSHIDMVGRIDEEDLPELYRQAELLAYPSLYEGFGFPVAEAMACGTPVVTSNRSSLPEIGGCACLTVDPESVDALARGMERILSDPAFGRALSEKGLAQASQFSWDHAAAGTLAAYHAAIRHRHS